MLSGIPHPFNHALDAEPAETAEAVVDAEIWTLPTYGELLFGVR